jgi:hypothetical protein
MIANIIYMTFQYMIIFKMCNKYANAIAAICFIYLMKFYYIKIVHFMYYIIYSTWLSHKVSRYANFTIIDTKKWEEQMHVRE